jgi:hypothetical protein
MGESVKPMTEQEADRQLRSFGTLAEKMETHDLVVKEPVLTDAGYAQKYPSYIDVGNITVMQDVPPNYFAKLIEEMKTWPSVADDCQIFDFTPLF